MLYGSCCNLIIKQTKSNYGQPLCLSSIPVSSILKTKGQHWLISVRMLQYQTQSMGIFPHPHLTLQHCQPFIPVTVTSVTKVLNHNDWEFIDQVYSSRKPFRGSPCQMLKEGFIDVNCSIIHGQLVLSYSSRSICPSPFSSLPPSTPTSGTLISNNNTYSGPRVTKGESDSCIDSRYAFVIHVSVWFGKRDLNTGSKEMKHGRDPISGSKLSLERGSFRPERWLRG